MSKLATPHMGLALAVAAAGLVGLGFEYRDSEKPSRKVHPLRDPSPNDFGPVIDTTPESKRARRRRLALAEQEGRDDER